MRRHESGPDVLAELIGEEPTVKQPSRPVVASRGSFISREQWEKMDMIFQGALRIMAKKTAAEVDDLTGEAPAKAKSKAKSKAKDAAPAKGKAKEAAKPAKKAKKESGGVKGTGKFYFPPEEREKLAPKVKAVIAKGKITSKAIAEKLGVEEVWKVRLTAQYLASNKEIKIAGKEGNVLSYAPK